MSSGDPSTPPCKVLIRSKKVLDLFTIGGAGNKVTLLENCATTLQTLAPDGSVTYVHVSGVGIVKCDLTNPSTISEPKAFLENSQGVQMLDLSPSAKYILTWERYYADKCPRNLKVWESTGKFLASFTQKNISREGWPYLQWTFDERFAFLLASTQVRVYKAADIQSCDGSEPRFVQKVQVPCSALSLPRHSKEMAYYCTVFSPKTKDKPATTSIYEYRNDKMECKAAKSLFQAEECVTHWSPTGTACLLSLQTAVDATGQSYYGSSLLWLWNTVNNDIMAVPLPQEGPVHAVEWVPNPDKPPSFVAVAGRMPAMASQHHGISGQVTFLFGNNVHRNTLSFSPHARFLCLAGFGNLAGGVGFWDINKKKLLPHSVTNANGSLKADATVTMHSWSPDSRLFLVATTAPRMNVDNGVVLYKYTGERVDTVPWNNTDYLPNLLLEACFVPALLSVYPDRPQSPTPERDETELQQATTAATAPIKPSARKYVPPSARKAGGSTLADRLRIEKEGQLQGATKVVTSKPPPAAAGGRVIPGMAPAPAPGGKSKSQIKREKMKKKEQQRPEEKAESPVEPKAGSSSAADEPDDPAKRARKLKKVLRQIDELKQGSDLTEEQKAKVATEPQIRKELEELGL